MRSPTVLASSFVSVTFASALLLSFFRRPLTDSLRLSLAIGRRLEHRFNIKLCSFTVAGDYFHCCLGLKEWIVKTHLVLSVVDANTFLKTSALTSEEFPRSQLTGEKNSLNALPDFVLFSDFFVMTLVSAGHQ
ncbi:hypothetical protein HPP92_023972 [Vanilla planifolia]|uniref:Uncharacterized protein n=1 Tax=Vanilla planifolia TaxID=51239 RepID=A0A835PLL2_VANPL|nr:hypothetical protein HPP92_023972 [Vanilla planifolia]